MEQLAAVVHPTRIDGCAEKESVALAAAVHATRIPAKSNDAIIFQIEPPFASHLSAVASVKNMSQHIECSLVLLGHLFRRREALELKGQPCGRSNQYECDVLKVRA